MKQEKLTRFVRSSEASKKWYLVDAKDQTLGRIASKIAAIIRGKNKPTFTPNMDTGDFVIVINADKVKVTGKRAFLKEYYHNSGYPGGAKFRNIRTIQAKKPEFLIEHAVKGMLPKNRLGNKLFHKLKVYAGEEHPHSAQKPELIKL